MRALIFGAGGQVGRALVETAPAATDVVALDRARCDICVRRDVERAIHLAKPDIVFNAAAFTAVDRAETEVAAATALNAEAPRIIADAARTARARSIHISTDYVFDGTADRPYRPDDATNPQNVYGRTKLAGENAVRRADPTALTVRTMWLYSSVGANFLTTMLRLMREREQLQVVSDQIGTPTSARTLAAALWTLAQTDASGVLHYRDAGTASWHDFALAIRDQAQALGLIDRAIPIAPVGTAEYPAIAARPPYSVLEAAHTWQRIGVEPSDWRDSLRLALEEIRVNG